MNRVVLFEPEKPANTGNIIRTCKAFDLKLTIIGNISFEMSDKAFRRAQMDYCIGFEIERFATIEDFMKVHGHEKGYYVTRYSKNLYSKPDYSDAGSNQWFMFGRESTGIPKEVLKTHLENSIRIPMTPDSRSLNLSNSVAIIMSEVLRQQNYFGLSIREEIKGEDLLSEPTK
ncbi:MAG: tRNA (cytidine(34)-2'-O)-methyltransferase [Bacilli bacterium]